MFEHVLGLAFFPFCNSCGAVDNQNTARPYIHKRVELWYHEILRSCRIWAIKPTSTGNRLGQDFAQRAPGKPKTGSLNPPLRPSNKRRPLINKPPPFKGLNIGIPILTPIKGRGFVNQWSGLPSILRGLKRWDESRWVEGSLVYTRLYWGLIPVLDLPSSHLLSALTFRPRYPSFGGLEPAYVHTYIYICICIHTCLFPKSQWRSKLYTPSHPKSYTPNA